MDHGVHSCDNILNNTGETEKTNTQVNLTIIVPENCMGARTGPGPQSGYDIGVGGMMGCRRKVHWS
jgi:hypothetical protein